ncbi:MAG: Ldh family oxidoreductase [Aquincola sp.]|nr:Ldh family oxidoreductase [Aquincola sp.]MDH4288440.1 Ldh family oxidoreductase [Aquincola sp.]MDH5330651.1 Ldh family oxidoreductase [Aquincola sp.]
MTQPVSATAHRIDAARLREWGTRCLAAAGMTDVDAAQLAASLVQTSLWGIDSHGIALLPHYLDRLANGTIRARPAVVVRRTAPATAMVEADQGHGIVIAHRAMDEAIAIAREQGVGAVGVRDSSHCGAIGLYARQATHAGCVGIAFTHANSVAVPHGGQRAYLGTNPIAIAVPREGAAPVCLDMATTSIPWNRVRNARREGHALPDDVAVDAEGRVTTDAHAAAAVMPLGGAAFGHKGYALALMIDLLCGPLLGNPYGPHIPPMFEALDAPRRLGALFIAIDPERFGGREVLATAAERMAVELAAEPGAPRMPSDPEHDHEAERLRNGVPVEDGLATQCRAWSERLGVRWPEP